MDSEGTVNVKVTKEVDIALHINPFNTKVINSVLKFKGIGNSLVTTVFIICR